MFLLSTRAQERFDLPPPEGFLGGKRSKVGPLMVPQMLVPGMLFASSVTSAGLCEGPGVCGKQHRGQGGMGTHGNSLAPCLGDIWPRLVLFSQRFVGRRQTVRGL